MIAEITLRDPIHFAVWATGAALWTIAVVVGLSLFAAIAWQAVRATASVAAQLWRVRRGAKRNPDVTIRQAWWFAFWHRGLTR
jgi:hypothetical protein